MGPQEQYLEQQIHAGMGIINNAFPNTVTNNAGHQHLFPDQALSPSDYQNVHQQLPIQAYGNLGSRQKGQALMNTQVVGHHGQPGLTGAHVNTSIGNATSSGKGSFENKVSKTPQAAGAPRQAPHAESDFSSNNSTADKAYSSQQHQAQLNSRESRKGHRRQISRAENTNIDSKVVKVHFPLQGGQTVAAQGKQVRQKGN